jgi:thiol:disulfide interchange protein DsbD
MMFLMAWGMGLLLILAGTFTGVIPRSGMWMNYVKTAFGVIMLWGALYFFSPFMPDGVYHLAVGVLLVAGSVFMGGWDSITAESGVGARLRRAVGLLMVLGGVILVFSGAMAIFDINLAGYGAENRAEAGDPFVDGTAADLEAALASGEPVVLDFSAPWCALCRELEHETFSDPRVVEELKRFRAIKVNFDDEAELVERYKVPGPPRLIFFDSGGRELERLSFNGFKDADAFLEILRQVK